MFEILAAHSDGLLSPTTYTTSMYVCSSTSDGCSKMVSEGKAGCLCWKHDWKSWDVKSWSSVVVS